MNAPLPPSNIASRKPRPITVAAGEFMHRFHAVDRGPVHFDKGRGGQLNAPDGANGVLYAAKTLAGAFVETFLRQPGRRQIAADLLAAKAYAELQAERALFFVRLAGAGLATLGERAEVTHRGLPSTKPRAWWRALHAHPAWADGIGYTARHHDSALCHAIFDRAADAIK